MKGGENVWKFVDAVNRSQGLVSSIVVFVSLDRSSQSKSASLHVPGNCYLVTDSAAVAIGCAVDWGSGTESPFSC